MTTIKGLHLMTSILNLNATRMIETGLQSKHGSFEKIKIFSKWIAHTRTSQNNQLQVLSSKSLLEHS